MGSNVNIPLRQTCWRQGSDRQHMGNSLGAKTKVALLEERRLGFRRERWFGIIEDISKRPVLMELVPLAFG